MRSSDWSSDVCSSDLIQAPAGDVRARSLLGRRRAGDRTEGRDLIERVGHVRDVEILGALLADHVDGGGRVEARTPQTRAGHDDITGTFPGIALTGCAGGSLILRPGQIGGESCGERVCQYV